MKHRRTPLRSGSWPVTLCQGARIQIIGACMLMGTALLSTGCVERMLTVTSEPSGALLHINDKEVGRTPVSLPFKYYGTYDVRLQYPGYDPLWTVGETGNPWWEWPGPDLIAEAIPGAESNVSWHYVLVPTSQTPEDAAEETARLKTAARQLRTQIANEAAASAATTPDTTTTTTTETTE